MKGKAKFLLGVIGFVLLIIATKACDGCKTSPLPNRSGTASIEKTMPDSPILLAQAPDTGVAAAGGVGQVWSWLKRNWIWLLPALLALAETIVRLTPSEKDNSILNWLKALFDKAFPNFKTGGGVHA